MNKQRNSRKTHWYSIKHNVWAENSDKNTLVLAPNISWAHNVQKIAPTPSNRSDDKERRDISTQALHQRAEMADNRNGGPQKQPHGRLTNT